MDVVKKIEAHLTLGAKMRELQRQFFAASVKRDFAAKNRILPQAKALEKKFDQSTREMLELVGQGFQPELFR